MLVEVFLNESLQCVINHHEVYIFHQLCVLTEDKIRSGIQKVDVRTVGFEFLKLCVNDMRM